MAMNGRQLCRIQGVIVSLLSLHFLAAVLV